VVRVGEHTLAMRNRAGVSRDESQRPPKAVEDLPHVLRLSHALGAADLRSLMPERGDYAYRPHQLPDAAEI